MIAMGVASATLVEDTLTLCRRVLDAPDDAPSRREVLEAAVTHLPQLARARLPLSVQARICEQMRLLCTADAQQLEGLRAGTARFERLMKIALLKRFPAGLFEWEVTGVSRRYCVETAVAAWPRVGAFIALRMRGLRPVFFSHLGRVGVPLTELEANRSYYRMALALELQPEILGFAACSWFRSPDTHRVSPHLAWVSEVFERNGGLVVDAGYDGADSGALYRSPTRRALYESGKWRPRRGLVMWPRAAMLAWAARHPEFAD